MRPIYLAVAAVVAVLLAGAMILPRLLENDGTKAKIAQQIEALAGRAVDLRGNVDFKLDPAPKLSISQVLIGNPIAADEPWLLSVDRVDLDVAFLSLFGGQIEVEAARLVRPSLLIRSGSKEQLGQAVQTSLRALSSVPIVLIDANINLQGLVQSGEVRIHALDLHSDPRSGNQGAKIEARGTMLDELLELELETRNPGRDGIHRINGAMRLGLNGKLLDLDGGIDLQTASSGELEFEGGFAAHSDVPARIAAWLDDWIGADQPLPAAILSEPLSIKGDISQSEHRFSLQKGQITTPDNKLDFTWSHGLGAFALELETDRLQLPDDAPDRTLAWIERLANKANNQGSISARIDTLGWRAIELTRINAEATLSPDLSGDLTLTTALPGSGTALFEGSIDIAGGTPVIEGDLEAGSQDLAALMAWFKPQELDEPVVQRGSLESGVRLEPGQLTLQDMVLRLDATRFEGSIVMVAREQITIAADLAVDRLDLDRLIERAGIERITPYLGSGDPSSDRPIDLAVNLKAKRVRWQRRSINEVDLETVINNDEILVRSLEIADFFGSHVAATGRFDRLAESVSGVLDLRLATTSRLGRIFDADEIRALSMLVPLNVSLQLDGAVDAIGFDAGLDGNNTAIALSGTTALLDWQTTELDQISVKAPDLESLAPMAAKFFDPPLGDQELIKRPIDISYQRETEDGTASATVIWGEAGGEAAFSDPDRENGTIDGSLHLWGLDPPVWRLIEQVLSRQGGLQFNDPRAWIGAWPRTKLEPLAQLNSPINLSLEIAEQKDQAAWIAAKIRHQPGAWFIDDARFESDAGSINGNFWAQERVHAGLAAGGNFTIRDGRFQPAMAFWGIEHAPDGGFEAEFDVQAVGQTPDQWIRSLSGQGAIKLSLDQSLLDDAGRFRLAPTALPLSLERGVATLANALDDQPTGQAMAMTFDLASWMTHGRIQSSIDHATLDFLGPINRPDWRLVPDRRDWSWGYDWGGP